ncbi:MAG: hypothetical protein PVI43_00555 [Candidatus Bathyarchaeota archaeon]|jgi:hypothetical protein
MKYSNLIEASKNIRQAIIYLSAAADNSNDQDVNKLIDQLERDDDHIADLLARKPPVIDMWPNVPSERVEDSIEEEAADLRLGIVIIIAAFLIFAGLVTGLIKLVFLG